MFDFLKSIVGQVIVDAITKALRSVVFRLGRLYFTLYVALVTIVSLASLILWLSIKITMVDRWQDVTFSIVEKSLFVVVAAIVLSHVISTNRRDVQEAMNSDSYRRQVAQNKAQEAQDDALKRVRDRAEEIVESLDSRFVQERSPSYVYSPRETDIAVEQAFHMSGELISLANLTPTESRHPSPTPKFWESTTWTIEAFLFTGKCHEELSQYVSAQTYYARALNNVRLCTSEAQYALGEVEERPKKKGYIDLQKNTCNYAK